MKKQEFSLHKRLKSFGFAFAGIITLVKEEHNSRLHILAAISIILAGIVCKLSNTEWVFIIFAIGFVFVSELFNSVIENLIDFITLEKHPAIKKIKDLAAAAVLLSAITALFIGCIVFFPKIF